MHLKTLQEQSWEARWCQQRPRYACTRALLWQHACRRAAEDFSNCSKGIKKPKPAKKAKQARQSGTILFFHMVPVKDFEATTGCHEAELLSYGQPHRRHVSFRALAQEREVRQSQLLPGTAAPGDTRDKKPQQHTPTVGSISTAGGGPAPSCPPTMPFVL